MRRSTYDSLPFKYKFSLQRSINRVTTLDGTKIPDLGCGYFWVPLFKMHIFVYIIKELEYDLLLGYDTLNKVGAILNCKLKYMELPTGQIISYKKYDNKPSQVTVVSSTFQTREISSVVTPVLQNNNSNVVLMNSKSIEQSNSNKQTENCCDNLSYAKKTDEIQPTGYKDVDEVLAKNKDLFRNTAR